MSDYVFPSIIGVGVIALVAALVFTPSYADGYCTALGGEKISSSYCNVNGNVVEVK